MGLGGSLRLVSIPVSMGHDLPFSQVEFCFFFHSDRGACAAPTGGFTRLWGLFGWGLRVRAQALEYPNDGRGTLQNRKKRGLFKLSKKP